MAPLVEEAGKATAAYIKPLEEQRANTGLADEVGDMRQDARPGRRVLADRPAEGDRGAGAARLDLPRPLGDDAEARCRARPPPPVAAPDPKDTRFKDPEWSENPVFDFLKQAYLITSRWAEKLVEEAEGLDEHTRHKAEFYVRQIAERALALELPRHQPRADPRDHPGERRQPRARHEDARRGHRGRRGRAQDAPVRPGALRGRRQHREHARQGRLPQRPHRADPVRAGDRDGAEAPAADRAALDQQVLRPRPQPGEELHPLGGRRRA